MVVMMWCAWSPHLIAVTILSLYLDRGTLIVNLSNPCVGDDLGAMLQSISRETVV
jgi:hypothetical protein